MGWKYTQIFGKKYLKWVKLLKSNHWEGLWLSGAGSKLTAQYIIQWNYKHENNRHENNWCSCLLDHLSIDWQYLTKCPHNRKTLSNPGTGLVWTLDLFLECHFLQETVQLLYTFDQICKPVLKSSVHVNKILAQIFFMVRAFIHVMLYGLPIIHLYC